MKYENDTHDEIERRFLVEQIPDLKDVPKKEIVQGYIDIHEEGYLGARIRKSDNEFFLTIKEGEGLVRREMEKPIRHSDFWRLWLSTNDREVTKTRHYIPNEHLVFELDLYHKEHEGFVTVEVEFGSVEEAEDFTPPGWFGQEITGREELSNRSLALKTQKLRQQIKNE